MSVAAAGVPGQCVGSVMNHQETETAMANLHLTMATWDYDHIRDHCPPAP